MDQELLEYLENKFNRVEDKVDLCATSQEVADLEKRVRRNEASIKTHNQIFGVAGSVALAGIAAWFQQWFGKH